MVDLERLKNVRGELKLAKVSRNLGDFLFLNYLETTQICVAEFIHWHQYHYAESYLELE